MVNVNDAWVDAIPENPYDYCPCGCGQKWRFVVKEGDVDWHYKRFVEALNNAGVDDGRLVGNVQH